MRAGMIETELLKGLLRDARKKAKLYEEIRIEGGLSDSPVTIYFDGEVVLWAMKKNARTPAWIIRWDHTYFGGKE